MKRLKHVPNSVPLRLRITLALVIVFLLTWILVQLITGYTFLPGKRGGALLPGTPTLMFAVASAFMVAASALTLIDHYDHRSNEAGYAKLRSWAVKLGVYIYLLILPYLVVEAVFAIHGVKLLPEFRGLGPNLNQHPPSWRGYGESLSGYLDFTRWVGIAFGAVTLIALLLIERFDKVFRREGAFLLGVSLVGVGACFALTVLVDLFKGEVRLQGQVLDMVRAPELFNAVVFTHFGVAFVVLFAGLGLSIAAATNRLAPSEL